MTRHDRCTVYLTVRDSRGCSVHEVVVSQVANLEDAHALLDGLLVHVDDELSRMEEARDGQDGLSSVPGHDPRRDAVYASPRPKPRVGGDEGWPY